MQKQKNLAIFIAVFTVYFVILCNYTEYSLSQLKTPVHAQILPNKEHVEVEQQYEILSETIREVTAYNAGDSSQCDSTPCIAANGEDICTAISLGYSRCAANFVPFGTILRIDNYGDCMVVDRMNSRYSNSVDIAMSNEPDQRERALKFGRQKLNVKILKKL